MQRIEGRSDASGKRFAIVASKWNAPITENLLEGAYQALLTHGANEDDLVVVWVPGSFEIPLACAELAQKKSFDALITVGALIKGDTEHFQLIANELTAGLMRVMEEYMIPIGFGVITAYDFDQAKARSQTASGGGWSQNKGWEAAIAAIEMREVLARIRSE